MPLQTRYQVLKCLAYFVTFPQNTALCSCCCLNSAISVYRDCFLKITFTLLIPYSRHSIIFFFFLLLVPLELSYSETSASRMSHFPWLSWNCPLLFFIFLIVPACYLRWLLCWLLMLQNRPRFCVALFSFLCTCPWQPLIFKTLMFYPIHMIYKSNVLLFSTLWNILLPS